MFETGVRQFRMAMSMVWGRRLDPANLGRLVDDVLATIAEFGAPGTEAQEIVGGPLADPEARLEWANSGLRRTARRLAARSPFYARRFTAAELDAAKLDMAGGGGGPRTTRRGAIWRGCGSSRSRPGRI